MGFECGYKFTLSDHYSDAANAEYLITALHQKGVNSSYRSGEPDPFDYKNDFEAIPSSVAFRPPRLARKPFVDGSQTAVVVGKSGEEIWVDKYGRVKVQFVWDREGKADENSSCWMRVGQFWAGKQWGAIYTPRIGQEVIVTFLEGDPDRPLITGSVYNADQMPPYTLPDEQTKSTIKSMSSKGGGGFNEFRFEDKKGSEQIFMHGEKDLDIRIKNDRKEWIGNDRSLEVVRDKMQKVGRDSHSQIVRDEIEKIGRDHHVAVDWQSRPQNHRVAFDQRHRRRDRGVQGQPQQPGHAESLPEGAAGGDRGFHRTHPESGGQFHHDRSIGRRHQGHPGADQQRRRCPERFSGLAGVPALPDRSRGSRPGRPGRRDGSARGS